MVDVSSNSTEDINGEEIPSIITFIRQANFVLYPVIVFVGLLGNAFSVLVMWKTNLKKISSNHYLVALALSDSFFLIGLLMIWLSKFQAPTYHARGACQTVLFLLNCSSWLSGWYITALTMERCYIVHRPLSKRTVCTIGRTRATVLLLIPWPVLFNVWVFFGAGVDDTNGLCNTKSDYVEIGMVLNFLDTLLSFVIPLIVVVACNISICLKLCRTDENMFNDYNSPHKKKVKDTTFSEMRKHTGNKMTSSSSSSSVSSSKAQRQEHKITVSLLIISFVFVLMNTPTYVMRLALYFSAVTNTAYNLSLTGIVFQNVFFLMYYVNFSINFFVYSLSSSNFRKAVKTLWFSKLCKIPGYESLSRTVTLANSISNVSALRKTTRERSIKLSTSGIETKDGKPQWTKDLSN